MTTRLEINDDEIKKHLIISEPSDELDTLFPAKPPPVGAALVKPKPGFCVKTKDASTSSKVFINVCTSDAIPEPEDLSNDELIAIFESDTPSDFKIPMSIGPPHQEKDKGGVDCSAYDVVVHPSFVDKMDSSPLFHNFFMVVTIEGLDAKYGLLLDKNNWVVLKNKKYQGEIPSQTIRTSIPLIQELSGLRGDKSSPQAIPSSDAAPSREEGKRTPGLLISEVTTTKIPQPQTGERQKKKPKFWLQKLVGKSSLPYFRIEIDLPEMVCSEEIKVGVSEDRVVVETPQSFLDEVMPHGTPLLKRELGKAFFVKSSRVLVLILPSQE